VLGAIATEGFIAAMNVEAATDSATLAAYLKQVLLPVLHKRKPDAVLVIEPELRIRGEGILKRSRI
jgi:hypothetical protein